MLAVHRNPTEESFIRWIENHPESFHALDMKRFYTFAKNVNVYHSKRWLNENYFRTQILLHSPNFSEKNIDYFFNALLMCRDYHHSSQTPIYDLCNNDDNMKDTEIKVINHKIKATPIDSIRKYISISHRKRK